MTPAQVPLFPLRAVLFPGGLLPLRVFEQRYLEMTKACLRENAPFGVCLIRAGAEVGPPAEPEPVGCLARIVQWDMRQLGLLEITARGERRFRILERRIDPGGLARAEVELLPEETDAPLPPRHARCREILQYFLEHPQGRPLPEPRRPDSCVWVSARLAELLPLPPAVKQQMLELDDGLQRLERLHRLLVEGGLAPAR